MSKSVLGISGAGIQRGNLASHLSTWKGNTGFLTVDLFISTKKNSTHRTQVAVAPLCTVCNFRKRFYCARCSESFFWGLDSELAFSIDAEVTLFQYVKTIPYSNVTYFTATSGLDPDVLDKFSDSASLNLRTSIRLSWVIVMFKVFKGLREDSMKYIKESYKF